MGETLQALADWMMAIPPGYAYLVILVIAYGENIVPPIPGDVIVIFGGYMAGMGQLSVSIVILLSTIGGVVGFMTVYYVGYYLGDSVFGPGRLRWIPKREVHKVRVWLRRWGDGVVLANRFLTGARSVISLSVGLSRMNPWRIALYATLSALIWTSLLVMAGYFVGQNWPLIIEYLDAYSRVVIVLLFVLVALFIARRVYRARNRKKKPF